VPDTLSLMKRDLTVPGGVPERIELRDADVRVWRSAWDATHANRVFDEFIATVAWAQEEIVIFGSRHRVPRLVSWHGDPGTTYEYSGTMHEPQPWTPTLIAIRQRVEGLTGCAFNSVLLNRYRDGRDGMGWHADDERELGIHPVITSVSFGATRRFQLRHRRDGLEKATLELGNGDVLLMGGEMQRNFVHAVPKTTRSVGERINLTFRLVRPRQ
jgi:alkylated DNA repair dioxygenase AlkB